MKMIFLIPTILLGCWQTENIYFLTYKPTGIKRQVLACYDDWDKIVVLKRQYTLLKGYTELQKTQLPADLWRCESYSTGGNNDF